ncbi:MAG: Asp-tRNA(Asn)/Glu-tRNA(Gln) amidotransferase subunit GatC [Desulfobacteraceae bacterium]|nr:Asp-tRNA(Asn)/Glu-tRNA(Gln) amidotransferase subunit GatC [Desulfobacteraceae bacterium]
MKLTKEQVLNTARLARLDIAPQDVEMFSEQLASILGYMEKLNEVDTTGVAPTSHAISLTNAFRQDRAHEHLPRDKALSNAPEKDEDGFLVPKVI